MNLTAPERKSGGGGLTGLFIGTVSDNADPEGLDRVRVSVPGVIEESDWAWPLGGLGGGSKERGSSFVPVKGSAVGVFFEQGDAQAAPWYLPANRGRREALPGASDPDVHAIRTGAWTVTMDDRSGGERLEILDNATGDAILVDRATRTVTIKAATVEIGAGGLVVLDGVVTRRCLCAFTGLAHPEASTAVKANKTGGP